MGLSQDGRLNSLKLESHLPGGLSVGWSIQPWPGVLNSCEGRESSPDSSYVAMRSQFVGKIRRMRVNRVRRGVRDIFMLIYYL